MLDTLIDQVFPNLEKFGIKEEIGYSLNLDIEKKLFVLYRNGEMGKAPRILKYKLLKEVGDLTLNEAKEVADYVGTTVTRIHKGDIWLHGKHVKLVYADTVKLSETDFVIINTVTGEPVESLDTIYHYTTVIELINTNMGRSPLGENENFVRMTELSKELQEKYYQNILGNSK